MSKYLSIFLLLLWFNSCNQCNKSNDVVVPPAKEVVVNAPAFNADSAYYFTQRQVDFGPRNMNSKGHEECAKWLIEKAKNYADTVFVQQFDATGFDGTKLKSTNIIASFNPTAANRILLCAHWDTRPWADQDTKDRDKPILAASDGASGVAVLLEVARALQSQKLQNIGVDVFFIDAEDYGYSSALADIVKNVVNTENSFCLGSQYWSKHLHTPGYRADFGILLDMVGARNAVFTREGTSAFNAGWVQDKVWSNAAKLGYASMFSNQNTAPITDDHYYINGIAKIPTVDIIQFDASTASGFAPYWHTHNDNMSIIDKNTLDAVGKVVLYTVYQYEAEKVVQ
ncbi:MAG: M28 family peptidase [Chitinophagales bacterium]|nr:M28 family peptidase [Chitinophagales bacterium]